MARKVFFSFHYERDIWRAAQIRNSWVTKSDREIAGFWDAAKWEQVKKKGDVAVRNWIDSNLKGTSVTTVLIGAETSKRKWVRYEIEKSIEKGNDIIGIRIHNLKDQNGQTDRAGNLDFELFDEKCSFSDSYPVYDWINDNGYDNLGYWIDNVEYPNQESGFWDTIATLALVGVGIGFISAFLKTRCPYCNYENVKWAKVCVNCGMRLK